MKNNSKVIFWEKGMLPAQAFIVTIKKMIATAVFHG